MKISLTSLFTLIIANVVIARQIPPFHGWDSLEEESPNILVVHCLRPQPLSLPILNGPSFQVKVNVVFALKGTNNPNVSLLLTDYSLTRGENYLVFGNYDGKNYNAYEQYRVIPLGISFSTNSIAGKPLDEQIQILFKERIADLNKEIQKDQQEKQRLEEGLTQ